MLGTLQRNPAVSNTQHIRYPNAVCFAWLTPIGIPEMRIPLQRAARAAVAVVAAAALVLISVPFAANAAPGDSIINVKVGGERTGSGTTDVAGVQGVLLQLYYDSDNDREGGAVPGAAGQCTTNAGGVCSFTVPNTQNGGANHDDRFWVKEVSATGSNQPVLNLTTGDGTNFVSTPYIFRTPELSSDTVNLPADAEMPDNYNPAGGGSDIPGSRWATTGIFPVGLPNPRYQAVCNVAPRIGILFDLSTSMQGDGITGARTAGKAMVDALVGSGAYLGIYNFGTNAPKSGESNHDPVQVTNNTVANTLKGYIDDYDANGTNYTNWDRGFWQLVNADLDIVIVLTDGNPTVYGNPATTGSSNTRFNHVEQAIFSANAVKKAGTQVLTFGVGDGVSGPTDNLAAVSGPIKWAAGIGITAADYAQTSDWNLVKTQLAEAAKALTCQVPITINKTEKLLNGTTQPGNGWDFTTTKASGSGSISTPATKATASGTASWTYTFTGAGQQGAITLGETLKSGWAQESFTCTNNGSPLTLTPSGSNFTTANFGIGSNIVCTVVNKQLQTSVQVNKVWVVNGTSYNDPNQLPAALQAQLKLQNTANTNLSDQAWGVTRDGYAINSTVKITEEQKGTWPALCTWDSAVINGTGATNVNVKGAAFTSPALAAGLTTYTITNTVTCKSELKLVKQVVNNNGGTATPANWNLTYTGGPQGGVASGTTVQLTPGAYTIGETAGPAGYTQTNLVCSTGLSGSVVTLPIATTVTCTFTNTDAPASLTLQKIVVGAPGVGPENWTLTAKKQSDQSVVLTGAGSKTGNVVANTPFVLSESSNMQADFNASAWECQTGGTGPWTTLTNGQLPGLAVGSSTVCRITNTAKTADPQIDKQVTNVVSNANGTWTITYNVTVTNPSKFVGITYNLSDTLAFGGGITPSATATGPSGPIAGWNGVGNTTLATGVALAKQSSHVYTVTATATLANGISPSNLVCPSADTANGGFMNRTTLTVDGKTYKDEACATPFIPTIAKAALGTPTDNGDGTWTVKYTLTVKHPGTGTDPAVYYDLNDTPSFPAGVTIVSSNVDGTPIVGGVIANDATIAGGATKVYTVTTVIKVAASVPAANLVCEGGKGLKNTATLIASGQTKDSSACQTIALPSITHTKTVESNKQQPDGSWTVVYKVTVRNNGTATGVYSLTDEPKLTVSGALTMLSASAAGPSGPIATWNGTSDKTLATDRALAAGATESYTITTSVGVTAGESDNAATKCAAQNGTNGFLNSSTITVAGVPATATACANPAYPTVTKTTVGEPVDDNGQWTVKYKVSVANTTSQDLYYTVSDTPDFPAGVQIVSTTVDPAFPDAPVALGHGETDDYNVTIVVTIPASVTPDELNCSDGGGLNNIGTIVSGNQTFDDSACHSIDPPVIHHTKTVTSTTQGADGDWTVVYDIAVENEGPISGYYSLDDTLRIDEPGSLTVVSATATAPGGAPVGGWTGSGNLATDRFLAGNATEHWTVTAVVDVASGVIGTPIATCGENENQNGFLNTSLLTVNGEDEPGEACSEPSLPKVVKTFDGAVSTGAGTWDVTYTITVSNTEPGAKASYYTLDDTLGFPAEVTKGEPVVTETSADPDKTLPWNDGAFVSTPRLLAGGATDVFQIVVSATVPPGAGDLECTDGPGNGFYNKVVVAVGNDELPAEDCGDITESVVPNITKTVKDGYPQQQADGTWVIQYDITVSSTVPLPAEYDLSDTLDFGQGIGITSAKIIASPPGVTVDPDWDGGSVHNTIATGVTLPAAPENGTSTHVYTVEAKANVPAEVYEDQDQLCDDGKPADKGGFLNTALLSSGDVEREAQACAEPAQPEFDKVLDPNAPLAYANGKWTVTYLLTVTNDSDLQLSYDLSDTLGFPQGATISGQTVTTTAAGVTPNPLWNGIVPATSIVDDQVIAPNTEHVFTVTASATLTSEFSVDDAECTGDPGSGLFNGAVMTSGGIPQEGEACAELPVAKLTLVKTVDNSDFDGLDLGGHTLASKSDWTLTAEDGDTKVSGTSGTADVTSVLVPAGEYELSEAPVADPGSDLMAYYTAGDWSCLDGDATAVEIETGDDVTCTIENTGHPVDLSIDKDDNGAIIDQGDPYTYTFTVKNNGDIPAQNVVVTDQIPATLRVDLATVSQPLGWGMPSLVGEDSNGFGGTLTFTKLGPLAPGDTQVITFQVTSADDLPRDPAETGKILDIVNTAKVGSSGVDLDPSDNESTETTPVKSIAIDITGICVKNAPYASWSITPYNADPANTVSIIWWTQDGYDNRDPSIPASDTAAILADGALQVNVLPAPQGGWVSGTEVEGSQLWAGASVDQSGVGNGWPGYKLVNGNWVLDPTNPYYPIRDSAIIEVRMNPSTGDTVGYPPAQTGCKPPSFPDLPTLALTGATFAGVWVLASGLFLLLGALLVVMNRRKAVRHRA